MRSFVALSLCLLGCLGASETSTSANAAPEAPASSDWTHFGAPFELTESIPSERLLADPGTHADQTVRVTGRLADVCQKAGCWMVLADNEGRSVRITTGHTFFVAKDTKGRMADIEGKIVRKKVEEGTVAHYASERTDANAVIPEEGKSETYELVATGVSIASKAS